MSEKRKWFDRKSIQLPIMPDMEAISRVSREEAFSLLEEIESRNIVGAVVQVFYERAACDPARRLQRNLHYLFDLMCQGYVGTSVKDLLLPHEYMGLVTLARKKVTLESQRVAHDLLNISERYQARMAMTKVFNDARNRSKEYVHGIDD